MDTSKLRITVSNMKNANSRAELERIKTTILENLSKLPAAPSVPFEKRPPALATVRHSALNQRACLCDPAAGPRLHVETGSRQWLSVLGNALLGNARMQCCCKAA